MVCPFTATVRRVCLVLVLTGWSLAPGAETIEIPADLVAQLFAQQTPNATIPKRAFNLTELEAVIGRYAPTPKAQEDLTRRYLKLSYPAGTLDLMQLAGSGLPRPAKLAVLRAPESSVRLSCTASVGELLGQVPRDLLLALLESPAAANGVMPRTMDAAELLQITKTRYAKESDYDTHVPIHDTSGESYVVSSPRLRTHLLGALLDKTRNQQRTIALQVAECADAICKSVAVGEGFASFAFIDGGADYLAAGQAATAKCRYDAGYRRVYDNRTEIELAFTGCTLETVAGGAPHREPLLDDLRRVR